MSTHITLDEIKALCLDLRPVGSRVTCDPPPTDTDADYLVLVDCLEYKAFEATLFTNGFVLDGSMILATGCETGDPDTFQSFSRDKDNLIVTSNADFWEAFLAATSVAKRLNLLNKEDRIALFQAVLYSTIDGANP